MKTYNIHFSKKSFDALNFTEINKAKSVLVQIFSGICDKDYIENVIDYISKSIPNAVIIGATTDGEICNATVSTDKVVVSISTFKKTTLSSHTNRGINKENSYFYGEKLAHSLSKDTKAMIIFGDGLNIDGDAFLEGVSSVNSDVAISGGLAGDNMAFKETFVMCNDGVLKHGIVAVMLEGEELIVNTDYKLNLMSIGNELKITHAQKNRVYTINNKKADEVYRHYLGEEVYKALPVGGFEFPLVCEKDGMQVARSVVARHEDGSIEFAGNIDMGLSYNIGFASVNTLLQDMNQSLVPYENKAVESLFVYSCMVRRRFFKDYIDDETSLLTALGPVSGFFTYGEFYKNEKNCVMLNQTMTTLALSESAKAVLPKQECIPKTYDSTSTLVALHHLISVSNRELKEYKDKFNHLAYYDNLTSLANREKLKMKFDEELEQIKVTGNICAFIFLDLNRFKSVNDTYGHEVGDKLLKMVSKRLQKSVREEDVVSRVGGDEFIILLRQISQEDTFKTLDSMSTRIVNVLELPFQIDGIHIEISTSIGTSLYGLHGNNMDDLIKFADKDMYANKKSKSRSEPQKLVEEMEL